MYEIGLSFYNENPLSLRLGTTMHMEYPILTQPTEENKLLLFRKILYDIRIEISEERGLTFRNVAFYPNSVDNNIAVWECPDSQSLSFSASWVSVCKHWLKSNYGI